MKRYLLFLLPAVWLLCPATGRTDQAWQTNGRGPRPAGAHNPGDPGHAQRAGGLGLELSTDGGPRIFRRPVPYYGDDYYSWLPRHLPEGDFGMVTVDGETGGHAVVRSADWSHIEARFPSRDPAVYLDAWISRVSPAVVFATAAERVRFFQDAKAVNVAYLATRQGEKEVMVPASRANELPLDELNRSWLLVWFGGQSRFNACDFPWPSDFRDWVTGPHYLADCPMLLVFEKSPIELRNEDGALAVRFDGSAGHFALLPLFGQRHPHASETQTWTNGLPREVAAACDWWAEHLAEVPVSVREDYRYDAGRDRVDVTSSFSYVRLREGGERFAPLPPMLTIARAHGFPVNVAGDARETSVLTPYGPYAGVVAADHHTVELSGLGRYVFEHAKLGPEREPEELSERLQAEIQKVLQAGHLAPWYVAMTDFGAGYQYYWRMQGRLAWSNPGETLYVLAETLPVLPPRLVEPVEAYMRREREQFPPESVAHTPVAEGARRERYELTPDLLQEQQRRVLQKNFHIANHLVPVENIYFLEAYYRALGERPDAAAWRSIKAILAPYLEEQDWASLGWFKRRQPDSFDMAGTGGAPDANDFFAAAIGYVRMARGAGDEEAETLGWGLLARAALLRFGMAKYAHYLTDHRLYVLPKEPDWMTRFTRGAWTGRLYSYHWTSAGDDVRSIGRMDQFGVQFDDGLNWYFGTGLTKLRGIVPEEGRFFGDYLRPEIRGFVRRVEENSPNWYLAMPTTFLGAEFYYQQPEESYSQFLARAWALGEPAEKLESFLDVSWMKRGDLFYIHKLAATVKRYRGIEWRR